MKNKDLLLYSALGFGGVLVLRAAIKATQSISVKGKVILITGGSRGLGLVLARQLASEGARIVICARKHEELERAKEQIEKRGAFVQIYRCDVTDQYQVDQMIRFVTQEVGPIDVLINNAGLIQVGPMETMTVQDYEDAMKLHFWAPLFTTLAVLPSMKSRREGRIVNISSIGGKVSLPHLLPYSASKFALVGFSEGLRAELKKDNVHVTTVCPGLVRTGSFYHVPTKGKHKEEFAWFSIADSLPVLSMGAEKTAREIISGFKRGQAEIITTLPSQVLNLMHGIFPGLTADILGAVNSLLPSAEGTGNESITGKENFSQISPSVLTRLSDEAAKRNNQFN